MPNESDGSVTSPDAALDAAERQYLFDEQAGRLEYDSGFPRVIAEQLAVRMLSGIVASLAGGGQ